MAEKKILEFKIIPQNERYYSEDSNFGVYVFTSEDDIPEYDDYKDIFADVNSIPKKMSILSGKMQRLYIGSEYKVNAELQYNQKYKSYQYIPTIVTAIVPKSMEQQQRFLESIITSKQAEALLSSYENIVEDVINNKDFEVDISKLKGIGEFTWNQIKEKIIDNYVISDILVLLQPLGVTFNMIQKLLSDTPNPSLLKEQLLDDPYIMTRIRGMGFKIVDGLALKLNPDIRVSSKRTYAFIKFYLKEMGENDGHTWIDINNLESAVRDNINECIDIFYDIIKIERANNSVLYFEDNRVSLKSYYYLEKNIFEILQHLDNQKVEWNINVEQGIKEAEKEQGFEYLPEQIEVINKAVNNNVVLIAGRAGSGKTSLSRALLKIYKNYSIGCAALSAKAAQRITEATGYPASTIHRLLGAQGLNKFNYNYQNPLPVDVILIDECSMINSEIFYYLLSSIKEGSKVIMCGDNRQLPPIGYGNIFSDLLEQPDKFNVNKLTKVLRQAEKSGILCDANKIREGIYPIPQPELKIVSGELQDMIYMFRDNREALQNIAIKTYLKSIDQESIDDVIIIVPRKKDCINSTAEINKLIQDELIPDSNIKLQYGKKVFKLGAKVIQCVNNYDKNIFNGEIGYITKIWEEQHDKEKLIKFEIEFRLNDVIKKIEYTKNELDEIDLAYALTVHKCLPKDTYLYTNKGLIEINTLDQNTSVNEIKNINSDITVYNGVYLEKPNQFYNAGLSDCKNIITNRGYNITATLDHGINILTKDFQIERKNINEINKDEYLLLRKGQNIYGNLNIIPNIYYNFEYKCNSKKYKLPQVLDKNFARFLGYMVADGTLFKKGFRLTKRYLQLVKDFKNITDNLFGLNYEIKSGKNKYEYTISSTYISSFLYNIDGLKPNNKFIPDIILQAPLEIQCEFLKSVFEDGTVNIKNGSFDHIELVMHNKKMQKQISLMLLNMGIICSLKHKDSIKKNNEITTNYVIYIYKEYADIFYKNIGFIVDIKNYNLKSCIDCLSYKSQRKSIPYLKEQLINICKIYNLKKQVKNKYNLREKEKHNITIDNFYKFYNYNKEIISNDQEIKNIIQIINNYYIDKIESISELQCETVCLTMPETHQFIQDGFYGWNCQGSGYKTVIAIVDNTHYALLDSCLLYTAITRAKKRCLLLAEPFAFKECINNNKSIVRQTWLKDFK